MLSPFPVFPHPKTPISSPPPPSLRVFPHPPTHSRIPALAFPYTAASSLHRSCPPIDVQQDHLLLYICSWIHGCLYVYSLVGVLVPGSSGGGGVAGWLIFLFFLWGLQNPSAPSVLSLTPLLGTHAQSHGCVRASASVFVRLWESLSGDSYVRLLSGSTSWHRQYCLCLAVVYSMDPQVG
jgi:hypothetical protein